MIQNNKQPPSQITEMTLSLTHGSNVFTPKKSFQKVYFLRGIPYGPHPNLLEVVLVVRVNPFHDYIESCGTTVDVWGMKMKYCVYNLVSRTLRFVLSQKSILEREDNGNFPLIFFLPLICQARTESPPSFLRHVYYVLRISFI